MIYNLKGSLEKVQEQIKLTGFEYGISFGRKQPKHIAHESCEEEIYKAGLHLVLGIGSANAPDSKFYNPLENPLTVEQQIEQHKISIEKLGIENFTIVQLQDFGDKEIWPRELAKLITSKGIDPTKTLMHYIPKDSDKNVKNKDIKSLSEYDLQLNKNGISVWQSKNLDVSLNDISATPLRLFDLNNLSSEQVGLFATPEYIIKIANEARNNNPDKDLISHLPVTMLDLTLSRLIEDKGIKTSQIFGDTKPKDINDLYNSISMFLGRPGLEISGNIKLEENKNKGVANGQQS